MRLLLLLALVSAASAVDMRRVDADFDRVIDPGATLERLGTGMRFSEGPVWSDADGGFLIFSDIPADELKRWSAADGVTAWRAPSGQANGNIRDPEGRLITCEHATRRVSRTAADGAVTALVEAHAGKRLNSPNDAAVAGDGAIWFTDPPYGIAAEQQEQER